MNKTPPSTTTTSNQYLKKQVFMRFGALSLVPLTAVFALLFLLWNLNPLTLFAQTGTTRYATPGGTGACTQLDPCALQTAVSASIAGDEVLATSGTYPRLIISRSITVSGGYTNNFTLREPALNPSRIDGSGSNSAVIVEGSSAPTIDGFHIQNGSAVNGGGILVDSGNPTISSNWIHDNVVSGEGGGIFIRDGQSATIENNEIYNNQAGSGGGILVSFGNASAIILFNDIHNNTTTSGSFGGGGIFVVSGSSAFLEGNLIHDNNANQSGGGLTADGTVTAQNNMIYNNDTASGSGGGIHVPGNLQSWNNTIAGNDAGSGIGGGINVTFGTVQISNTIVVSNTSGGFSGIDIDPSFSTVTGDYNNIFGNSTEVTFTNTVSADPRFINYATFNLHLSQPSPNINQGDPFTSPLINQDIDRQARPNGAGVDIGADEFYANVPAFSFTPAFQQSFEDRNTFATYGNLLVNGNTTISDTYSFVCSNDLSWNVLCPPAQPLEVGEEITVSTQISVPGSATALTAATTRITATSAVSPSLQHVVAIRTIVNPNPGLQFTPNISTTTAPGNIITLTHTLTNTGDAPDVFEITFDSNTRGWAEIIPNEPLTVPLGVNASANIQVEVTVPPYAAAIIPNIAQIRATSSYDVATFALVTDTVRALETIGTRYVSLGGTNDNNNCTQPSLPCQTVQHAIEQAVTNDEVRLAATGSTDGYTLNDEVQINETIHVSGNWSGNFAAQNPEAITIIESDGSARLFALTGAANTSTFEYVTLRNGDQGAGRGGAINIGPNVQAFFDYVTIAGSQATHGGAVNIESNGFAQFSHSAFISNTATVRGGAIHISGGTLIIKQSTFIENNTSGGTADNGGAVYVNNSLLIAENDLFYLNTAVADGGALFIQNSNSTINHNTIVNNSAADQGGGLYVNNASQPLRLVNSILADNNAASGPAIFANAGTIDSDFVNYWNNSNAGGGTINETNTSTFDPNFADPEFRLSPTSQLVDLRDRDTGDPGDELDVDFEDDGRPSDEGYDLGYDELAGCSVKRDSTIYGSIQEAIDDPGSVSTLILVSGICRGVHDITQGSDTISQTVHLTGTQTFTIQGGWNGEFDRRRIDETTIVDPQGLGRAFYINGPANLTLEYLTLVNGDASGLQGGPSDEDAGGIIYNNGGQVTLKAVSLLTGTADLGGAYFNLDGSLETGLLIAARPDFEVTPANAEIALTGRAQANTAVSNGAAFYINSGTATIDSMHILSNTAVAGAGLYQDNGVVTATNSVLAFNNASGNGAGIYDSAAGATALLHLTLYENTAGNNGGGIYIETGASTAVHSNIFQANQAADGDALFAPNTIDNDFNYYHSQPDPFGGTVSIGGNSTNSATPPGLVDPDGGDFHLQNTAPAIDMGDPNSPVGRDFDDDPRPSNQAPDMGADEVAGCLAELNGTIYGSIQAAMTNAQNGDTIRVSGICSGVHEFDTGSSGGCGGDTGLIQTTVHIDKNVILQGGWNEDFTVQGQEITILNAANAGRVIHITPGITATVESFHIINGSLSGANGNGAGICIDNAEPTIRSNHLITNSATNGGGIYALNSNAVIDGNRIYQSTASTNGAGVYVTGGTNTIWNNFIYLNTANANGGGFYNNSGNHLYWHNTLVGNQANSQGGAATIAAGSPELRSNIFFENSSPGTDGVRGNGGSPVIDYNNAFGQVEDYFGTASAGPNALSADPLFTTGAYTLTFASPMVDVGDPAITLDYDFEDDIRLSHLGFDVGADEIGGCFARNLADPSTVYGSLQLAVDLASDGDTIQVDGVCRNAKTRNNGGGTAVSQNLFVDKTLTIDGDWNSGLRPNSFLTATLDALSRGRVVYIDTSGVVTLTNIQLVNGEGIGSGINDHGGGIYNTGALILDEVEVQVNNAANGGGIYNTATVTLQGSHVHNNSGQNGAGLYNAGGTATIVDKNHFDNNVASGAGGGVYQNAGTLFLDGNKIYENVANGNGGGVMLAGGSGSNVNMRNNFVYRNQAQAGGGVYNSVGGSGIWHNTFYNNTATSANEFGAGIYSTVNGVIHSNIVDNNNGSGIHTAVSADIDFNNVVDNLVSGSPMNYSGAAAAGSSGISTAPTYVNHLQDDFHLESISAGVDDADPNLTFDNDFDGHLRPTNGGPDRGADEINSCLIRVTDPNDSNPDTRHHIFGVLQEAIDYAESLTPLPDKVEIARGECSGVLPDRDTGFLQVGSIRRDLIFEGSLRRFDFADVNDYTSDAVGRVSSVINALGEGRVLYIHPTANPVFEHLAFVQGDAAQSGDPNLNGGGVVISDTGSVGFEQSYICESTAVNGGGIYAPANSGPLNYVSGATVGFCIVAIVDENPNNGAFQGRTLFPYFGNSASGHGGGLYAAGNFEVRNSAFWANNAGQNGGGLYNLGSDNTLVNAIFMGNNAVQNGGGVFNSATDFEMYHNTIRDNTAGINGGGVRNEGSLFVLNSSILFSNTASIGTGGGLSSNSGGTLAYNNYFDNTPDHTDTGFLGPNALLQYPNLFIFEPRLESPVIDRADPALLNANATDFGPVDYDADLVTRPDGGTVHSGTMRSDIGAFEWWKDFGCAIEPTPQQSTVSPGNTVQYQFEVINTGNPWPLSSNYVTHGFTDTITVSLNSSTSGWSSLEGGNIQVFNDMTWLGSEPITLTVNVPPDATTGMSDQTILRCESASLATAVGTGQANTNVGLVSGVIVYPSYPDTAIPGEVLTYTHTVQNVGNEAATFVIRPDAGDQFASAVLLESGSAITETFATLAPNETVDVILEVTILSTAVPGELANPGVVAAEVGNEAINNGAAQNNITIINAPGTRHVAVGGLDNTNCTDPTNPCGTVQYAVDMAYDADDILVAQGVYNDTVTRTINSEVYEQNVYIDKPVNIQGGYSALADFTTQYPITQATTLDGEDSHRVIYLTPGITVTLSSLFIENGDAETEGDGQYGGGIYNAGAHLTISGTWVLSNSAKFGGGLYQAEGTLQTLSSVFAHNDTETTSGTPGLGAGVLISDATAVFENNTFHNNDTNTGDNNDGSTGGGIYMSDGSLTSLNNIFSQNVSELAGAVYISAPVSIITSNYNIYWINSINYVTGTQSFIADPEFSDTFFHIAATSPAKDAGSLNTTLTNPADFDLEPRIMGTTIDIGADERLQRPNFIFTPLTATAAITASTVYTYEFTLFNNGDSVDSYEITMSNQSIPGGGNWSFNLPVTTVTNLALNTGVTITLEISGSDPGFVNHTILTATTTNLVQPIVRSVEATTTITFTPGVDIEMSETGTGNPGLPTNYTHVLTNTGDGTDSFVIQVTDVITNPPLPGWSVSINPTQTGFIAPGATVPFTVSVTPPAGAPPGAVHTVTVAAMSLNILGIDVRDTLTDVTTVEESRGWLFIPDFQAQSVPDNTIVTYTHTLQNIGNVTDTATLTVTGTPGSWNVTIEPPATPSLMPLQSIPVTVTVTVPQNTGGLVHTATLTATSDSDATAVATAVDETTVQEIYAVQVTPDLTQTVDANTTVYYTHTITNSGNVADVYTITAQSTLTWTTLATPGPIALGPGMTDTITVTVIVPPDAEPDFPNTTMITATSQANPAVFDTAVDTTRIRQIHSLIFIQDETGLADPGTNISYTHWLTNTGNGSDSFSFTAVTPNNWVTAVPPDVQLGSGQGTTVVVTLTVPNGAAGRQENMFVTAASVISPTATAMVTDTTNVNGISGTIRVDIEPDNMGLGNPGDTVIYTHTVTNTGTITEDFVLSTFSENGWLSGVMPMALLLTPNESAQVMVTTTIPASAPNNSSDVLTVTVTSQTEAAVSDSARDTTTVGLSRGVIIEPDQTGSGNAGEIVTYSHVLTNTGNAADTFAITTDSSNGWVTPDPPQVTVGAGLTATVVVTLEIPAGAPTTTDIMTVVATSVNDAAATDTAVDTTNVIGIVGTRSVIIEPDNSASDQAGATVDYNHTITNTGTITDDFRIMVNSSQGWTVVSTPASGSIIRLDPNQTANVTIRVTIPTNATVGTVDVTTVTVQSLSDSSSTDIARDTTTVVSGQTLIYLPVVMRATTTTTPPTPTPSPTPTPCAPTTNVDLVVTQIQVVPSVPTAGVPATVNVTIRNIGSANVTFGNNFFLDFYVNRIPQPFLVGDIVWGVQGSDLAAGTSQTYSAPYTFNGGNHQLFAQVDTDQHVNECPNENNNILGPVNITVSGTANHVPDPVGPQFGPRQTPAPVMPANSATETAPAPAFTPTSTPTTPAVSPAATIPGTAVTPPPANEEPTPTGTPAASTATAPPTP